jgi:tRNA(Ile)-lysidine synthase
VVASSGVGARAFGGPGYDVVERVWQTIGRYRMLEDDDTLVVAVSGGPDSICLLDALARLKAKIAISLVVAHVDHGISERSAQVAAKVAHDAAEMGFEVHVTRAPDLSGPNLQARAREFRYGFFEIVAQKEGAQRIATGHTLDDRVETTLARLIHGAAPDVLAGIPPMEGARIRPLIDVRRGETRAYCEEVGLDFFEDPANEDERFERVAVRHQLVAAVEEHWGEGAVRAIARSAERLFEDSAALRALADRLYADVATGEEAGEVAIDVDAMLSMPRAFRRRVLEKAVGRVRDRHGGIDAALDALEAPSGQVPKDVRFDVASGIQIEISADRVLVRRDN